MLNCKNIYLIIFIFLISQSNSTVVCNEIIPNRNSSLYYFNEDINFNKIDKNLIHSSTEIAIQHAETILLDIISINDSLRTFNNTLLKLDDLYNIISNVWSPLDLLRSVHPNDDIRNQSNTSIIVLQKYLTQLSANKELFDAIKAFSKQLEAKTLPAYKERFLISELRDFKYSGLGLSPKDLKKLIELRNQNSKLSLEFENNINSSTDTLFLHSKYLNGLPNDYLKSHFIEDDIYWIDLSYPSYYPFMTYAESDSIREILHYKFNNRGMPENKALLKKILTNRKHIARMLGYKTYSDYSIENSMAQTKEAVFNFENNLLNKISNKATQDTKELIELKKTRYNIKNNSVEIFSWDKYYYENKLLINKYSINSEIVKEYFELDNVINGLFHISSILFNIKIIEIKQPSVWHEEIRMFKVYDKYNNKLIAKFYLDLFPRKNKYQHAAAFSLISGKAFGSKYQLPISALVCNFSPPTSLQPSLLLHEDVETLFHEFGHLLHDILTTSELMSQSGTSVASDFVEAPAQLFENWAWNKDALKLFAKHYKTNEIIPDHLLNNMISSKQIQSGNNLLQQIFYGMLDLNFHGDIKFNILKNLYNTTSSLQNEITNYKYHKGTHLYASFDHLLDYGASYYGYLWSEVYALDMYSVFVKGGVLNPEIGMNFRNYILEKGDTQDPIVISEKFIGRKLDSKAFLLKQGIK